MVPKLSWDSDAKGLDLTVKEGEKVTTWTITSRTSRQKLVDVFDQIATCLAGGPEPMNGFYKNPWSVEAPLEPVAEPPGITEEEARAQRIAQTNALQASAKWFEAPEEVPDYDSDPNQFPTFKD